MAHVGHGALIGRGTYRALIGRGTYRTWHIHGGKVSLTYLLPIPIHENLKDGARLVRSLVYLPLSIERYVSDPCLYLMSAFLATFVNRFDSLTRARISHVY